MTSLQKENPYDNKAGYTLVSQSKPFEVKDEANALVVSHGRTFEYRTKCSGGKRLCAIFVALITLGLALVVKAVRDTCAGRKFVKVDVALTEAEVEQLEEAKKKAQDQEPVTPAEENRGTELEEVESRAE